MPQLPSVERLHELLRLDEQTGALYWRRKPACKARPDWRAGWVNGLGYRVVLVEGAQCLAHRIAFALCHGRWPNGMLDHANGARDDNRPANLREATSSQNNQNRGPQSNNISGVKGVSFHKGRGKWFARIKADGRVRHLGYFDDPKLAGLAYASAADRFHGAFARVA